jgi:mannosyl-oligosaccharide alpha-1,2-mannosidase
VHHGGSLSIRNDADPDSAMFEVFARMSSAAKRKKEREAKAKHDGDALDRFAAEQGKLEHELDRFDITDATTERSDDAPTATPAAAPAQAAFYRNVAASELRRAEVKDAFLHAWNGYVKCAWGHDELRPVSCTSQDQFQMGLTILDSLSTLHVMGLRDEFAKARQWVAEHLNATPNVNVSVFETTIRCLGGLLSAFDLSKDRVFLDKARELGDALLHAFNGNGVPMSFVNLKTGAQSNAGWHSSSVILSEVGTLQLEFLALAYHTGDAKYAKPVMHVIAAMLGNHDASLPEGLYANFLSTDGRFSSSNQHIAMGALGDSFYEYLLKVWLLTGKRYDRLRQAYASAVRGVETAMKQTSSDGFVYVSELHGRSPSHRMDHLACFSGGMFALGAATDAHGSAGNEAADAAQLGRDVARTCMQMYRMTSTQLPPESVDFAGGKMHTAPGAQYSLQRPETAETLMYLYRITGDESYRDMGYEILQGIVRHEKVENGFSGVRDVNAVPPPLDDLQQSFLLAETFKYLYLLYDSSANVPLDKMVFNTEAHPLAVFEEPDRPAIREAMKEFE